jgi:peptidoglycan/LPS O-acetylase OafA/YrhL
MLGGVGVDLFFVLSGFLITGILVDAKGGPFFFRNFYMRRVLRIFPLYYGALLVLFVVVPRLVPEAPGLQQVLQEQAWYWSYLANIRMAFDGWPAFHHIGHFWSLAVEEQFYMLWPLVIFLSRRRTFLFICAACVVACLAFRVAFWWAGYHPMINVLTINRMDALAWGAFLAAYARTPGGMVRLTRWAPPVAAVSGGILGVVILWAGGWVPRIAFFQTVGRSLLALFFAGLLVIAITVPVRSRLGILFNHRVLVFFGVYSYGLYVIHLPYIITMRDAGFTVDLVPAALGSHLPGQMLVHVVATGLCVVTALLSYHFFEEPFLKLKRFFQYGRAPGKGPTASPPPAVPGEEAK